MKKEGKIKKETKMKNKVKKEKKGNKKSILNNINAKSIKISTIILAIVLIAMISFFGIYKTSKNTVSNTVKEYTYAMDINGARNIKLKLDEETTEVIKDKDGNEIEEATDEEIESNGYTKEEVPNNSDEDKTVENYKLAKSIIEKRLKTLGVQEYNISLNESNGEMNIEIPENTNTDNVVGKLTKVGKFEIIDADTKEVLIDNSNIKSSGVLYNNGTSGTAVYLDITFDKEGKKKLEEISKTYVKAEEENTTEDENVVEEGTTEAEVTTEEDATEDEATEEETEKTKQITMKIDDEEIMTTSFDEPIVTGKIQLSVGSTSKDETALKDYISQAQSVSIPLDTGKLPLKYNIDKNQYILSTITHETIVKIEIAIAIIAVIGLVVLVVRYKVNGLLSAVSYLGLVALFVLLIRYANVVVSIESIFGIIAILGLDYIFTMMLLDRIKENTVARATVETYTRFFFRTLPICIMVIAFCFVKWIPISSFGMITFWGLVMIAAYNAIVTRYLLKLKVEDK